MKDALQGNGHNLPGAGKMFYIVSRFPGRGDYSDNMAMAECLNCEKIGIPADAVFCPYCGKRFIVSTPFPQR